MLNLSHNLITLFSGFGRLQHLTIRAPERTAILANCFIEPIKHLPLLESLELAHVLMGDGAEYENLPTCISNLTNLKQLILKDVELLDRGWAYHKSPPQLVNLVIHDCLPLRISDMPWFIETWVPQLTHFDIKFHNEVSDIDHNLPIFDPDDYLISLPALTHLTIWPNDDCPFIRSFADCKTLRHLKVYQLPNYDAFDYLSDMESEEVSELSDFLTSHVFPNLKTVALHIDYDIWPLDPASLKRLKGICRSKGIRFSKVAENAKEKLLHNPMHFHC
ncbi:uncharacterized protein MELLADRAFT_59138 [Melampsora larici-populina 98AG31]|uniref:Uncharacterized protein n=1 Tax=Melampsora larici-populina (strain 98AG31 / pathotype 3-4-7) TaxID=747676 RepID=F4R561_MELLP|nr:uncharacterized protein MELLADRAFT_59138 [Melampsora larici-populina 98AG31]EGG12320.1 hypothetical protein MELLADRAFT_59138 [Melampsora larici-populina 98AG31]